MLRVGFLLLVLAVSTSLQEDEKAKTCVIEKAGKVPDKEKTCTKVLEEYVKDFQTHTTDQPSACCFKYTGEDGKVTKGCADKAWCTATKKTLDDGKKCGEIEYQGKKKYTTCVCDDKDSCNRVSALLPSLLLLLPALLLPALRPTSSP